MILAEIRPQCARAYHLGRFWGLKVLGNFDTFLDLFDHLMQFRGSVERV